MKSRQALGLEREPHFVFQVVIPAQSLLFRSISVHDDFAEVPLTYLCVFGVWCRRCDNRIALVEVTSRPKIYQWFIPRLPRFKSIAESAARPERTITEM
jgi:hypothetical protein